MIGKNAVPWLALATMLVACGGPAAPRSPAGGHHHSDAGASATALPPNTGPSARAGAGPGGHGTAPPKPSSGAAPQQVGARGPGAVAVAPPAGHYVYQATGCTSCDSLGYRAAPSSVASDVSDQGGGGSLTVVTSTVVDSSNSSTSTVAITPTDAHEVHLTTHGDVGPVAYAADITPQPPFLVAPLPFQSGQSWQFSWQDSSSGTSGTGTGQTVDEETVATGLGSVDTYLVEITMQLQNAQYTASTTNWVWIDPRTHVTVKWRDQRTIHSPAGSGRYDVTAVLSSGPAA